MSSRRPSTRTSAKDADERPGSFFNEIVMLPTLAPHLARPEYVSPYQPGAPIPYPQPRSQQMREGVLVVAPAASPEPSAASSQEDLVEPPLTQPQEEITSCDQAARPPEATATDVRMFDLNVHTTKSTPPVLTAKGRMYKNPPKPTLQTFLASKPIPLLELSRAEFINDYLFATLNAKGTYVAGPQGPPLKCWWKGFAEKNAPIVTSDEQWETVTRKLGKTRMGAVDDFHVHLDITDTNLAPYQVSSMPLAPTISHVSGMPSGTQVPSVEGYTECQQAVGAMVAAVRKHHQCDTVTHTTACFVDRNKDHWPLNRFRENQFVDYLLADSDRSAEDDVPDELIVSWRGEQPLTTRPRGRTGPGRSSAFDSTDFPAYFAQGMGMLTGVMASAISSTNQISPAGSGASLSTPSSSSISTPTSCKRRLESLDSIETVESFRVPRSSPPPEVEDELRVCLERFGKRRKLSDELVTQANDGLSAYGYFPSALAGVKMDRIKEITGLNEGQSEGLKQFAVDYSKIIEGKRERRQL